MKVADFLRLCELQRQMQEDPYVSEEDIYALEDEFVLAYGELPSCHVCGETGHIKHGPKTIRTFPLGPFWRHAYF